MSPTSSQSGTPASRIMELVRRLGTVKREELARRTGLSTATIARAVSALIESGLLRYGIEHATDRGVGRPGTPLQVDSRTFIVIGVHLGRRMVTVALGDLSGRVLDSRIRRHREGELEAPDGLDRIGSMVADMLAGAPARRPLATGVVAPWRALGWDAPGTAARIQGLLGLDIATGEHISAMATAEFLSGHDTAIGSSAFVYARETAGFVVLDHDGERPVLSREISLTHFPTGSAIRCECGRTGCLIATAGDSALAHAAYARGIVTRPRIDLVFRAASDGKADAHALLADRARVLTEVVGHVADMCGPDHLIIAGQPFTADPDVLRRTRAAVSRPVGATRFGAAIQAHAACAVALRPVDENPLGLAPRGARAAAC